MDVVVVGAGLGGLGAAAAAHRAGHAVSVLERAATLRETGAGIGLMPNGVRALDALGLGGPVRERATAPPAGGGPRGRPRPPCRGAEACAPATAARCWPSTRPRSRPGPGHRWSSSTAPGCTVCSPP